MRATTPDAHLTPHERAARGKAARDRVPRSSHALFEPPANRTGPVEIVERQSAARVPELVPIRYGRMLESPFRFYRGAAAIMASDLGAAPHTGIVAQLCGDAHLLNFRLLASAERNLVFDINDFDETLPGPWEWDVKRLSASLAIAGRENDFSRKQRETVVRGAVGAYRDAMRGFAGMTNLAVWYTQADADQIRELLPKELGKGARERVSHALSAARTRDNLQVYKKLTKVIHGERRIAADPPLIVPLGDLLPDVERHDLEQQLRTLIKGYGRSLPSDRRHLLEQFRLVDAARKVVGVGSVGTRCWVLLMLGKDDEDPLLLQAKEADQSVLAPYAGAGEYENQGQRVVSGQRLMQAAGDIFLGWERVTGIDGRQRDFYVRQLRDWKGIAVPHLMPPDQLEYFGRVCGTTLARAHARSGDRIAIASYLGSNDSFDRALAEFAELYADQNERDFQALTDAARAGRVTAETV
ncbi:MULTISPECIES: DUF2252 domain-containing protein [unclassified Streptomyces]|uniref:DUF2252 domain-containing protein n=1 Tax=unclassified Streptomyces TaxID=2593676 RepID=UPI002DD85B5A|nr:DUF2252 domain-containing protein [Streptomyces sp. NBC_01750]WSB01897.1 DUF2252 domain-containing protein [Streptomyces sp. NBC_01794]WSD33833.1 DUF2252 domain-containing protein [Streptomyces sp. NBC_01750]